MTRPPPWLFAPPPMHAVDGYSIRLRIWAAKLIVAARAYPKEVSRG